MIIIVVVIVMVARVAPTIVLVAPAIGLIVLLACAVLFHSLSVEVTTTKVRLWFGAGLIHKTFAASEIREARVVRNRWIWGWGIRLTPHGWLFNVSGLDAVEIELLSGRQYRIGTDQPHELHAAIEEVLGA